jgi:hypothetical protein
MSLRTMFLSVRSDDPVIGPLENTGGRVSTPRIYKSRELAGLLLVGLLSLVGVAVTVGLTPAKLSDSATDDHDPRNSISLDQQATYTPMRASAPAVEGAETTLGGRSSISEVHIVGQDAPTSKKKYGEPLAHPPAPDGNATFSPELSSELSPVLSQPVSPVLLRPVDRTALQNLTASLLVADHSRPEQAEPLSTSATLAQGPRHRQRRRTTPAKKRGMSGRK